MTPGNAQPNADIFDFKRRNLKDLARLSRDYFAELNPFDRTLQFADNWDERYRKLMAMGIGSDRFFIRGVRSDKEIIGFIMFGYRVESLWKIANRGYISNIYVIPEHRRKGVGILMVRDAVETLLAAGSKVIELEVYTLNRPGRAFWSHLGFGDFKNRLRLIPPA